MDKLFLFFGLLLGYTLLYAGFSHFGSTGWFASPKPPGKTKGGP